MSGSYERIGLALFARCKVKPAPFCIFEGNRLHVGTKSLHRTSSARVWRLFWRLKHNRIKE